jgi:PAS domain S-box-containing protein
MDSDSETADQDATLPGSVKLGLDMRSSRHLAAPLGMLLEDFPALIWRADSAGKRDYLNRAWLEFTGRSLEQELGEGWTEGVHPEDAERCAEAYRAAFGERRPFALEYRLRRHDGRYRWIVDYARPIGSTAGAFCGYLGVCYDDSGRRHSAERVRALANRQKALAELSLMALARADLLPVHERACEVASEVLGLELVRVLELQPAGDALKVVAGIGWSPDAIGALIPIRENSLVGYTLYSRELAPKAPGEGRRPVIIEDLLSEERFARSSMLEAHAAVSGMSVVIQGGGAPYGILGAHSRSRVRFGQEDAEFLQAVANVISAAVQRQRTQQRVQESEARLQAFARYSPAVMFLKDRDGRYRFVNEQFLKRFGLRRDRVIGRTDHEVFPAAQADVFAANDALVLAERRHVQFEEVARHPEGERTSIVSKFPILDASGAPVALAGVASDITEQKEAQASLREAAQTLQALTRRLVEAEEAERRRIARELHDQVGQNLSALGINLHIALGALSEGADAHAPPIARRIADSIGLVEATLQTIESVMADLRPPLLDEYGLGAALSDYADQFSRHTGIRVSVEEAGEASAELRPEAAIALFRIAQEALNNVAKHARTDRARVSLTRHNDAIVLTIEDCGCGLGRPAPSGQRKRWGMTTMRERAEAAGGSLEIESRAGEGTTVRATLPA